MASQRLPRRVGLTSELCTQKAPARTALSPSKTTTRERSRGLASQLTGWRAPASASASGPSPPRVYPSSPASRWGERTLGVSQGLRRLPSYHTASQHEASPDATLSDRTVARLPGSTEQSRSEFAGDRERDVRQQRLRASLEDRAFEAASLTAGEQNARRLRGWEAWTRENRQLLAGGVAQTLF